MKKRTLIGAALSLAAMTVEAQTPAPTPPLPPQQEIERLIESAPVLGELDLFIPEFPSLDFELAMPPGDVIAPRAPELFGAEPLLHFDELPGFDREFSYGPMFSERIGGTDALDAFDAFDAFDALDVMAPEPMIPMDPMIPLEPMIPMEPMTPMEQMLPMDPFEPLVPMTPLELDVDVPAAPPVPPVPPVPSCCETAKPAIAYTPADVWHVPGQSQFERQFGELTSEPPEAWAQRDPADSLYRLARQTLNRGEYRRASQLFGDISQRFPNSAYAADARYWKAFALYRIGGTDDLRDALAALEIEGSRYHQASLKADAATLAWRIRGALAQRGDTRAQTALERTAGEQGAPCDKEDAAIRVQALSSLGEMDRESTTPILRRILAKRDHCSASLRRNALFLLAKRGDPEATSLIIASARTETDPHVRSDALRWLSRMPGDAALATLEEIARTPGDESLQRSAVAALARSDSPRARQAIRNIIERTDLTESLRATALSSLAKEQSPDGGAYIRSVYPRLETSRLKLGAIRAVARIGGSENERWLLSIVRNQNEPLDVRSTALTYAARSPIPINELVAMYDAAGERPLRTRLISLYGSRSESEAAEKLLAIAKNGTDPEMRRMAISALSRKNDPRTRKLLLEILDK